MSNNEPRLDPSARDPNFNPFAAAVPDDTARNAEVDMPDPKRYGGFGTSVLNLPDPVPRQSLLPSPRDSRSGDSEIASTGPAGNHPAHSRSSSGGYDAGNGRKRSGSVGRYLHPRHALDDSRPSSQRSGSYGDPTETRPRSVSNPSQGSSGANLGHSRTTSGASEGSRKSAVYHYGSGRQVFDDGWIPLQQPPDIGYAYKPRDGTENPETLSDIGKRTLAVWKDEPEDWIYSGTGIHVQAALVVHLARSKVLKSETLLYVVENFLFDGKLLASIPRGPEWPESNKRPYPNIEVQVDGKEFTVCVEWSGFQAIKMFSDLQELGTSSSSLEIINESQRLGLLGLYILDELNEAAKKREDKAMQAFLCDWSPKLWKRLDARLRARDENNKRIYPQYSQARKFLAAVDYETANTMAYDVEDWVYRRIKDKVGAAAFDIELLGRGEIALRILRVWSQLHNARIQDPDSDLPWRIDPPPSQHRPISGARRRAGSLSAGLLRTVSGRSRKSQRKEPEAESQTDDAQPPGPLQRLTRRLTRVKDPRRPSTICRILPKSSRPSASSSGNFHSIDSLGNPQQLVPPHEAVPRTSGETGVGRRLLNRVLRRKTKNLGS